MPDLLKVIFATLPIVLLLPYIWNFTISVVAFIENELSDSLKTAINKYKYTWKYFVEDFKRLFVSKRKKTIDKPIPIAKNVQVEADENGVKVFFELPKSDPVAKKLMNDIEKGQLTSLEFCTDNKENR